MDYTAENLEGFEAIRVALATDTIPEGFGKKVLTRFLALYDSGETRASIRSTMIDELEQLGKTGGGLWD